MDKDQRSEGAKILRFPTGETVRLSQRRKAAAASPAPAENHFEIDAWYHQAAMDDIRDPAKH